MLHLAFRKARAIAVLRSITGGQPIKPERPEGWSPDDALAVAGCLVIAALSALRPTRKGETSETRIPNEHLEARVQTMTLDALAAVNGYAQLVGEVVTGSYDSQFEPIIEAVLSTDEAGHGRIVATRGAKARKAS